MTINTHSLVGAAGRLLLTGACLGFCACSAQGSIPDITVTETDLSFEAMPVPGINGELKTRFEHPGSLDLPDFLNPELHVAHASIKAGNGVTDLSFVDTLSITLGSDSPDAPPSEEMATYERASGRTTTMSVLNIDADKNVDVLDHWRTGAAYYELVLRGTLPDVPWTVDVSVQFNGKIEIAP